MMLGRTLTGYDDPLTNTRSMLTEIFRDKTLDQSRVGVALENEQVVVFMNIKCTNSQYLEIDRWI